MADFGYDVSDYCDIDPVFGTLADLDELIAQCHARDIKVVLDWVPNHSSDQHPWFIESRSSRENPKRDWYVWRDAPNDWDSVFKAVGPAWTFDETTGQYYLHSFMREQPDLNWENPEVVAAMHDVAALLDGPRRRRAAPGRDRQDRQGPAAARSRGAPHAGTTRTGSRSTTTCAASAR